MKIIICGAGQVGTSIARQLSYEDHDVTIIDHSNEKIRKITDILDVNAINGFASHPNILRDAGAEYSDMIIAVTASDEVNMVTCQVAHSLFNVPMKIARVRHQYYLQECWKELYRQDHIPIDVIISPELEVSRAVNQRLHVPGAVDTIPYANGKVKVVAIRVTSDSPLTNLLTFRIRDMAGRAGIAILGIVRDQHFLFPSDKEPILAGDEVFFVVDDVHLEEVMSLFGHEEREARRIIIIGGGNIGLYLAQQIEEETSDVKVKIIELDTQRAQLIAESLERTSVINGSALEHEILEEANVSSSETVISVSNDDEVNILSALLAKRFGCERAISLINSRSYTPLISSLGIDVVVNPREITVSTILQHIRRGRIKSAHTICNGVAEIIEAVVHKSSNVIGKTVRGLNLPSGCQVGVIIRNESMIIPDDHTALIAEDHIIMVCMTSIVREIEHIFSVRFEYF